MNDRAIHVRAARLLLCTLLGAPMFSACERKAQNAVVSGKDYIPEKPATAERQSIPEVWVVHVVMENGGRAVDSYVTKEKWDSLKPGDHVRMRYLEGKYSHAIWSSELE